MTQRRQADSGPASDEVEDVWGVPFDATPDEKTPSWHWPSDWLRTFVDEAIVTRSPRPSGLEEIDSGENWWYGGAVGGDGCVYYAPAGANRVLRLDPDAESVEVIGWDLGEFGANHKWMTCAAAPNGNIYAMPCNARKVLKVDTKKQAVDTIGPDLGDEAFKYHSCALGVDGCVYGIPFVGARTILRVDPSSDSVTTFGEVGQGSLKGSWVGGASGPDGCIYGIPRGANYVLKIDPKTENVSTIGPDLGAHGDHKWSGGVLGDDGCIYGVPHGANRVLKIEFSSENDPGQQRGEPKVTTLEADLTSLGNKKYESGARGADGRIYCSPRMANRVLCIDPVARNAYTVGPDLGPDHNKFNYGTEVAPSGAIYSFFSKSRGLLRIAPPDLRLFERLRRIAAGSSGLGGVDSGENWWYGGAAGGDGNIYYAPAGANRVLRLDPDTESVTVLGADLGKFGTTPKWMTCAAAPDGNIYAMPCNSRKVLKVDTKKQTAKMIGPDLGDEAFKYLGGTLGVDGCIYGIPLNARTVLRIDPSLDSITTFGELGQGSLKGSWNGGASGPDGCIYGIPSRADYVLKIDPKARTVSTIGPDLGAHGYHKWSGGALCDDGCIYGVPHDANRVLKIEFSKENDARVTMLEADLTSLGHEKYESGARGADGRIYCSPRMANRVLCIDPVAQNAYTVGPDLGPDRDKFNGGLVAAPSGVMYSLFKKESGILRIVSSLDTQVQTLLREHPESMRIGLKDAYFRDLVLTAWANILDQREPAGPAAVRKCIEACGEVATSQATTDAALALVYRDRKLYWPVLASLLSVSDLMRFIQSKKGTVDDDHVKCYIQFSPDDAHHSSITDKILEDPSDAISWLRDEGVLNEPSRPVEIFIEFLSFITKSAAPRGRRENKEGAGDQKRDELAQRLVLEVSKVPKLVKSLLTLTCEDEDCTLDKRKEAILQSVIIRRALMKEPLVEGAKVWIGDCLKRCKKTENSKEGKIKLACVARFFKLLDKLGSSKHDGFGPQEREKLISSLSDAFDQWLPYMMGLSGHQTLQVADFGIVRDVLDRKLTKRPAMLIVVLDGITTGGILSCYVAATILMAKHDGPLSAPEIQLLSVAILCTLYQALREANQVWKMKRLHLFASWLKSWTNMLDVFSCVNVFLTSGVALLGSHKTRSEAWFRILVVTTSCMLWLKTLSFLKILNKKMATFLLMIIQLLEATELQAFVVVLVLFLFMFTNAFYLLLSSEILLPWDGDTVDQTVDEGFSTFGWTLFTMYRMMLGDFVEQSQFSSKTNEINGVAAVLFVIFTFMVMVLLLNLLIAIISDSYDYAKIRAEQLFLQARIDLAAELVAIGVATSNADKDYAWIPNLSLLEPVFRFHKLDEDRGDPNMESTEEWVGRALDQERRTKLAVQASKEMVLKRIEQANEETVQRLEQRMETLAVQAIKVNKTVLRLETALVDQAKTIDRLEHRLESALVNEENKIDGLEQRLETALVEVLGAINSKDNKYS